MHPAVSLRALQRDLTPQHSRLDKGFFGEMILEDLASHVEFKTNIQMRQDSLMTEMWYFLIK